MELVGCRRHGLKLKVVSVSFGPWESFWGSILLALEFSSRSCLVRIQLVLYSIYLFQVNRGNLMASKFRHWALARPPAGLQPRKQLLRSHPSAFLDTLWREIAEAWHADTIRQFQPPSHSQSISGEAGFL